MDTKSLSSRQVRWAQKLFCYHFQIDYCQGKANPAKNTLLKFPQRSLDEEDKLQAENGQIFYYMQNSLTNASLAGLSLSSLFTLSSHVHQVFIWGTYVLPQLKEFWNLFHNELSSKIPYTISIDGMRLRLQELQAKDKQAQKTKAEHSEGCNNIDGVLHYQDLPYIPEIIRTKLISKNHDDLLAGYFGIEKTHELIAQKYYWPTLRRDVKDYIRGCNIYLALKAVWHKPYNDLESLPIPTHHWKNLSMDFVTGLPISMD